MAAEPLPPLFPVRFRRYWAAFRDGACFRVFVLLMALYCAVAVLDPDVVRRFSVTAKGNQCGCLDQLSLRRDRLI